MILVQRGGVEKLSILQRKAIFPETTRRNKYLDLIRGVSIFFVVFGHCIQYGSGLEFYTKEEYFDNMVFKVIYAFHMPLFAVVSGYLFYSSASKRSVRDCFTKQVLRLCVPVFTWTLSVAFVKRVAQVIVLGRVPEFLWLITDLRSCFTSLWFLWAMFLCASVVLINRGFFGDSIIFYILLWIIFMFMPDVLNSNKYFYLYPYYICAYLFNKHGKKWNITSFAISAAGLFAFSGFVIMIPFFESKHFIYNTGICLLNGQFAEQLAIDLYRWIIGLAGCIMVMWLVYLISRGKNKLHDCLIILGRNTLGIYIISNYTNSLVLLKITKDFQLNYGYVFIESIIMLVFAMGIICLIRKNRLINKVYLGGR